MATDPSMDIILHIINAKSKQEVKLHENLDQTLRTGIMLWVVISDLIFVFSIARCVLILFNKLTSKTKSYEK